LRRQNKSNDYLQYPDLNETQIMELRNKSGKDSYSLERTHQAVKDDPNFESKYIIHSLCEEERLKTIVDADRVVGLYIPLFPSKVIQEGMVQSNSNDVMDSGNEHYSFIIEVCDENQFTVSRCPLLPVNFHEGGANKKYGASGFPTEPKENKYHGHADNQDRDHSLLRYAVPGALLIAMKLHRLQEVSHE
jgi:hypothetical protein